MHHILDEKSPEAVRNMFSAIAGRYDFLNSLLSLRQDKLWRKKAVNKGVSALRRRQRPYFVLDIGSGTGELSFEFYSAIKKIEADCYITGIDISKAMLERAKRKSDALHNQLSISRLNANALYLPFKYKKFDIAAAAWCVRNLPDINSFLKTVYSSLSDDGRLIILEFIPPPSGKMKFLNKFYLKKILPLIGNFLSLSPDMAYSYLFKSILSYYDKEQFRDILISAGFQDVQMETLAFDIVTLVSATKNTAIQ